MGEVRRQLGVVLGEAAKFARATETFRLVTTEGAGRLEAEGRQRLALIAEIPKRVVNPGDEHAFRKLLGPAEAEARAQLRLAEWLRRLAGSGEGA